MACAEVVAHGWRIAEELHRVGQTAAAVAVLDGIVAAPIAPALVDEDAATRIRCAELLLLLSSPSSAAAASSTGGGFAGASHQRQHRANAEAARRLLEPALHAARHHHAVAPMRRVDALRLLCVVCRRRQQFGHALACADEARQVALRLLQSAPVGVGVAPLQLRVALAAIALEAARTHHALVADRGFADAAANAAFAANTKNYASFVVAASDLTAAADCGSAEEAVAAAATLRALAMTLAACHVLGLCFALRPHEALLHVRQAAALFGPFPEFCLLEALIGNCFGLPTAATAATAAAAAAGEAAAVSSPLRKRSRDGNSFGCEKPPPVATSATNATATTWLSEGTLAALRVMTALLDAAPSSSSSSSPSAAAALDAVDAQLRRLTDPRAVAATRAPSTLVTTTAVVVVPRAMAQSEVRLLVSLKLASGLDAVRQSLTRLDLCKALEALEPLCEYVLTFVHHSAHFRHHVHLMAAAVASHLSTAADAARHGLASCCGEENGDNGDNGNGDSGGELDPDRVAMRHAALAEACAPDAAAVLLARLARVAILGNRAQRAVDAAATATTTDVTTLSSLHQWPLARSPLLATELAALLQRCEALLDDVRASYNARESEGSGPLVWTPHHTTMVLLLVGADAVLLQRPTAAVGGALGALKAATDAATRLFGLHSPVAGLALRLLGRAHALHADLLLDAAAAGHAATQAEVALTTATRVSRDCGDAAGLTSCLAWALSRLVVGCDADRRQQQQLRAALAERVRGLEAQVAAALALPAWRRVATFLPGRADYAAWVAKSAHARPQAQRSGSGDGAMQSSHRK